MYLLENINKLHPRYFFRSLTPKNGYPLGSTSSLWILTKSGRPLALILTVCEWPLICRNHKPPGTRFGGLVRFVACQIVLLIKNDFSHGVTWHFHCQISIDFWHCVCCEMHALQPGLALNPTVHANNKARSTASHQDANCGLPTAIIYQLQVNKALHSLLGAYRSITCKT